MPTLSTLPFEVLFVSRFRSVGCYHGTKAWHDETSEICFYCLAAKGKIMSPPKLCGPQQVAQKLGTTNNSNCSARPVASSRN